MKKKKKERAPRARKTSPLATKVYEYGVPHLDPVSGQVVRDQLKRAHDYRNERVRIEVDRRNTYRAIRAKLSPEIEYMEELYDRAKSEYREKRKQLCAVLKSARDDSPLVAEVEQKKAECKAVYKQVCAAREVVSERYFARADAELKRRKEAARKVHGSAPRTMERLTREIRQEMFKEKAWPVAWKKKERAQAAAEDRVKAARKGSGCFHGVYHAVDVAVEQSFESALSDPQFLRFDGCGRVGIQVRSDSKVHLEKSDAHIRKGREAMVARIRLGGRGKGAVRIDVPFAMHRPLPEDAAIKWVYLDVGRVGLRFVYKLQFTIESNTFSPHHTSGDSAIAVHVGWRALADRNVRAAVTWDGAGAGELPIPAAIREAQEKADKILGHAADHFNAARDVLRERLGGLDLPEDVRERLQHVAQWRAHRKLAGAARELARIYLGGGDREAARAEVARIWRIWRAERLPKRSGVPWDKWSGRGRRDLFGSFEELSRWFEACGVLDPNRRLALYLEWWSRKDEHLLDMARASERRLLLHRREIYRRFARDLEERYAIVVIDTWDKREAVKKPAPEDDRRTPQMEAASGVRQRTGVYHLVVALEQAFGKNRVVRLASEDVLAGHGGGCGGTSSSRLEAPEVRCDRCERYYDQDVDRARKCWEVQRERSGGDGVTGDPSQVDENQPSP